ncbi:response regulator [Paraglaciecola sp. L1A13]|uniref:response regulator n=1 Tax=Paraglaciecola sp. L1A13 TaxID=2686359 RepID=UPI00131C2C81|nr:response regulator [Paraglaciecola sp. L1A13]|tara:strand:- start:122228 stop:123172 length:945 start_codon:yes stop_codon:yes gene_type:complete
MSVETLYKVILYPFINESLASLKAMTNLSGTAGEPFMDKVADFRFKGYAVCSEVTGNLNGVIMMHHYPETAISIGNAVCQSMFNEIYQHQEMTDDLRNALAEWGNTIVGRSTDLHSRYSLEYGFSSPYFVEDLSEMDKYLNGVQDVVTVPINIEGVGRYYFNLLIRNVVYREGGIKREESVGIENPHANALTKDSQILLVDDSAMIRKALTRFLHELGYSNVIEANDGSGALEIVKSNPPDFIFMDVVMNKLNGDKALAEIRRLGSNVPIVMLSSVTDQLLVKSCQEQGISGFIFKPIHANNGTEIIARYLKVA